MQLPGLTSEASPGPPRESQLLLGAYPPEMHSLQQPGGSLCSASSRPSKSKLLSTEGFVWDGKALHVCRDPAAPSLGKDSDHLCQQPLAVEHRSYNTTMVLMQSQTLPLHSLERIPAISTTGQSPCLPSPMDFQHSSLRLPNASSIHCTSKLFQTFSTRVVVCWGRAGCEESIHWVNSVLLSKWNKFHHPLQVHSVFYLYRSHLVQDSGAAGTGDVMHCTNSILFIQWENKVHSLGFFDHT